MVKPALQLLRAFEVSEPPGAEMARREGADHLPAALALSAILQGLLLTLAFAAPPVPRELPDLLNGCCGPGLPQPFWEPPWEPRGSLGLIAVVGPRGLDPLQGTERERGFSEEGLPRAGCIGRVPPAEVHAGHILSWPAGDRQAWRLRGSPGPSRSAQVRQAFERSHRKLRGCYRRALASCLGQGRLVLHLHISSLGEVEQTGLEARWNWRRGVTVPAGPVQRSLEKCVTGAVASWSLPTAPAATRLRLPIIFRYPGAVPRQSW